MKIHLTYIAIIVLLITVYFLDRKTQRLQKQLKEKEYNVLQVERDSISAKLRRSELERANLYSTLDSSIRVAETLELKLTVADRKLANIPHRYDKVPQDSLGTIMDQRAKDAMAN